MPGDRVSTFSIAFDGDSTPLKDVIASIKSDLSKAVTDIQKTTSKIDLFNNVKQQGQDAQAALTAAQAAVQKYSDAIASAKVSGQGVADSLTKSLKDATTAATAAEKAYGRSQTTLARLGTQLAAAGVNTKALATEQIRLAAALSQASTAQANANAKAELGITTAADIEPTILRISSAYQTLSKSGTLTNTQLAAAWLRQQQAIAAAESEVSGFGSIVSSLKGPALAGAAAVTVIGSAVVTAVDKFERFNDAVQRGAAITNLTTKQLNDLADGAEAVARDFGDDTEQAINSVFTLIRAGIPADNAVSALRDAALAAQGGFTDLGTAVQLGATILQGYGLTADTLPKIYDEIAFSAHNGGATVAELNASIGQLLPIAKAAHVPFEELVASIQTLRQAGLDTDTSVSVLKKVIAGLADPAVIAKLSQMGVAVNGLVNTLVSIGKQGIDLSAIKELGLVDARSISGVVALTGGYQRLEDTLDGVINKSAGTNAATAKIIDATQEDKVKKLGTAFEQLEAAIGKLGADSGVIAFLTNLANKLDDSAKKMTAFQASADAYVRGRPEITAAFGALGDILTMAAQRLFGIQPAAASADQALKNTGDAATAAAGVVSQSLTKLATSVGAILEEAQKSADQLRGKLTGVASDLAADVAAVQGAMAASLKSIDETTKEATAALQTQGLSQQAIEQQTVDITTKAAADRLKVLQTSSTQILAAFDAEAQARLALVSNSATKTEQVEQQLTAERKALIGSIVGEYQKQADGLVAVEAGYLSKIKGIDQQRVDFNRSIQNQIDSIVASGQGPLAAYQQKVDQIEGDLALAAKANADGFLDLAQKYAIEAANLVSGIGSAISENGNEVVSVERAHSEQLSLLTQAQGIYNQAAAKGTQAAQDGATATAKELDAAQTGLKNAGGLYDTINKKFADGLTVKIDADVSKAQIAVALFEDAIDTVDRIMHVQLDLKAAQGEIDELKTDLANGVTAGAQAGTDAAIALLKSIGNEEPKVKLQTDDAANQVSDLSGKIKALEAVKVDISAKASLDDTAAKKELAILSQDKTITYTVDIVTKGSLPTGGTVQGIDNGGDASAGPSGLNAGGLVQQFATGGAVFGGRKVPGTGNQDTYPAALASGSYVLRKSASHYYGDGLLGKLAKGLAAVQNFATGGLAKAPVPEYDPSNYIGQYAADGAVQDTGIGISEPTLPDDPVARIRLFNRYVTDLVPAARQWDGDYWEPSLKELFKEINVYTQRPTDDNFNSMLSTARVIGLSLGVTRGIHTGFDIDGRAWHDEGQLTGDDTFGLATLGHKWEFYNRGGKAGDTDTVPAMLTPGEWVINRDAVSKYGSGLFNALNNMAMPRAMLERMVAPPTVHRFAEGGQVPGQMGSSTVAAVAGQPITNNITITAAMGDIFNEANIRRYFVPAWNNIQRRSK